MPSASEIAAEEAGERQEPAAVSPPEATEGTDPQPAQVVHAAQESFTQSEAVLIYTKFATIPFETPQEKMIAASAQAKAAAIAGVG